MISKTDRKNRGIIHTSPWLIVGSVVILLITIVVLAVQNYNREKQYMSRILSEKGDALIKAVEAGARTGMMDMMWGGRQVQTFLEETARLPGVLFITILNKDGLVLAHSDSELIGAKRSHNHDLNALDLSGKTNWEIVDTGNQPRSFEVFRYFKPISNRETWMNNRMHQMMDRRGMMMDPNNDLYFPSGNTEDEEIILVGLDPKPFEEARREDIRNTMIISTVLVVLGMAGFISMFWMQSYRSAKRSLQDSRAFADEVVANLPVGIIATDRDGNIAVFNDTAVRITGIIPEAVRGKDPETVLPSHWCGLKEYLDQGETILEQEMECDFAGEKSVPVSVSAARIVNEEGQFVGNILILRDLGEVRQLQEEIRRKEKLAALGGLAAGVAHEIRNPLSSIKGMASYFSGKFVEGSEDREAAGVMVREVDRLNRVISELLEFARPSELKLKPTDINRLLTHSIRLIRQDAKSKNIELNLLSDTHHPRVPLDPDRFSQCLLNLYLNAIQAMDHGGVLSVRLLPGYNETIQIEIEDTGKGINPDDINKIFDPYFTTKSSGTGLGLAIVHKIVEVHQGRITVRSIPGKGTVFAVTLPLQHA